MGAESEQVHEKENLKGLQDDCGRVPRALDVRQLLDEFAKACGLPRAEEKRRFSPETALEVLQETTGGETKPYTGPGPTTI